MSADEIQATNSRTLDITNRDDLSYLEALADTAPRLGARTDMPVAPLTDFWYRVIIGLIDVAKKATEEDAS